VRIIYHIEIWTVIFSFSFISQIIDFTLILGYFMYENQGHTPLELLALLLLFKLPLLLTFQKLVVLPTLGERNHQLLAERRI